MNDITNTKSRTKRDLEELYQQHHLTPRYSTGKR